MSLNTVLYNLFVSRVLLPLALDLLFSFQFGHFLDRSILVEKFQNTLFVIQDLQHGFSSLINLIHYKLTSLHIPLKYNNTNIKKLNTSDNQVFSGVIPGKS